MKLEFDSTEKPETLRAVAAFALMLAGDIDIPSVRDEVPAGTVHGIGTRAQNLPREITTPPTGNVAPFVPPVSTASGAIPGTGFPPAPPVPSAVWVATSSVPSAVSAVSAIPANQPSLPVAVPQMQPAQMPPPYPAATAVPQSPQLNPPVTNAAVVPADAASVEYDKAGLPWDARIHNKGRTKKRDGTWKLQKGLDPIVAQTVVAELAAKRVSVPQTVSMPVAPVPPNQPTHVPPMQSAPQSPAFGQTTYSPDGLPVQAAPFAPLPPTGGPLTPDPMAEARAAFTSMRPAIAHGVASIEVDLHALNNPQVPLPPTGPVTMYGYGGQPIASGFGTLPVPPFPNGAPAPMVPPQAIAAPVPPAPQPGTVGSVNPALQPQLGPVSPYKTLIDKLTAATQNKTLNPGLVVPTVQRFGVPNMGMLGDPQYAGLLVAISQEFDRLIAGGAPSGP